MAFARDAAAGYPETAPFDPPCSVRALVERALERLGLDAARAGSDGWNPLGDLVGPGATVLVKPNLVYHRHAHGGDPLSIVTHGSVLRPLLDLARRAVGPGGRVVLGDAPQANADWDTLMDVTGIGAMVAALNARGMEVELSDMRRLVAHERHEIRVREEVREGKTVPVDLGVGSYLAPLGETLDNLFGADYDRRATVDAHQGGRHAYMVAREVLNADLIVTVPKLKTHRKVGITVALKGMVGINGDKNFIPHYRVGDAPRGGDEFPLEERASVRARSLALRAGIDLFLARFQPILGPATSWALGAYGRLRAASPDAPEETLIEKFYREVVGQSVRAGNWPGNDTLWRAVLDLNRIAHYADREGRLQSDLQRGYLCVADGIVGGDRGGPLRPRARRAGCILAATNPVAMDVAAAALMGFAHDAMPMVARALADPSLAPRGVAKLIGERGVTLDFDPPKGWDVLRRQAALAPT